AWAGSLFRTWRVARNARPALIHANDAPSFQPGGHVARLLGIPALVHIRFPAGEAGYRWFLRPGFTRALFVSNALREDALQQAPGFFDSRSEVLHDGVRLPTPATPAARAAVRSSLGIPQDAVAVA